MKYLLSNFSLVTSLAFAHPGHDHSHWSASFLHLLWYSPVILAILLAVYFIVKKIKKDRS